MPAEYPGAVGVVSAGDRAAPAEDASCWPVGAPGAVITATRQVLGMPRMKTGHTFIDI